MKPLVIITGASSGIGRAAALRFSAEGHPLLLLARRLAPMEALQLPNTLCRAVDVCDYAAVRDAIQEAEAKFSPADLLINNAGVMLLGEGHTQDFAEWERMLDVNVKGLLTGTHTLLPGMMERNHGTIMNVSSIAGRKTFDNHAVYCGSKFAVHAITESLRKEVSQSLVRCITIAPGVVETELLSHTSNDTIVDSYNQWKQTIQGGLAAETIADCMYFAYQMPQEVCVREIVIAKTKQAD